MLTGPRRNFGFLPTGGFMAHVFIVVFILIVPLLFVLWQVLNGILIDSIYAFYAGVRLLLLLVYVKAIFFSGTSLAEIYGFSKRTRYVRKVLIPFLMKRYAVDLEVKGSEGVWHLIHGQSMSAFRGKDKGLEHVRLIGWQAVEDWASGQPVDLEDNVYLVEHMGEENFRELRRVNEPDHEPETFRVTPETVPLSATEGFIHSMMGEMVASLPQGAVMIACFPRNTDFGTRQTLSIFIDDEDNAHYSLKEYSSFIETVIFNTRLSDETLMVGSVERDDKRFFWGRLIHNFGYYGLPVKDMERLSQNWEGFDRKTAVFVENVSQINNSTNLDH